MEESIYHLIEVIPPIKQKPIMFRSQFPGVIAPTGSTFNNKTTINHGINNMSGSIEVSQAPYSYKNESATFGRALKLNRYSSLQLKHLPKINSTLMGNNSLESWALKGQMQMSLSPSKSSGKTKLKPLVPILHVSPKTAISLEKNYIITNAVETMLTKPKIHKETMDFLRKSDYGKVPDYLFQVKQQINEEYTLAQSLYLDQQSIDDQRKYLLPQEEVESLKLGLKVRYDQVNQKYQLMTHMQNLDTVGLRRRKNMYEKEMIQIEKDLEKLNKQYIFIDTGL